MNKPVPLSSLREEIGTQAIVDRVLANIMDGIHSARCAGWCPVCAQPIASPYLPDDEPPPRMNARERERRRLLDLRVSAILLGRTPR